jgi:ABC-type cobalamin/Fe3+-siderophores transport system ATPase subunit
MLNIQSLFVSYNGHKILQDISLRVPYGSILAVIGPNGAGKTTLIRSISGVLPPRSGNIFMDGIDLLGLPAIQRARYLAVVPQARQLPAAFTVQQSVLLGRTPYLGWLGRTHEIDHRLVQQALEQTRLTSLAQRRVGELSGGEQQRVLLARALAQDTPILLLDEPTTHLDLEHQSSFFNLVRALTAQKRLSVLLVLHDLNLAGLYADQVALLVNGRIHTTGTPQEVLTEENLSRVYNVPVNVVPHPEYGTPLVLPDGK